MTNGTNGRMGVVPRTDAELHALLAASPVYVETRRAEESLRKTTAAAPQADQQITPGPHDTKALVPALSAEASRFMPVMTVAAAIERRQMIVEAIENLLVEGIEGDYGVIPGTKKKTLLQPGAQKLDNLFGLVPTFEIAEKVLDWTGADHAGEPFFYFEIRAKLWRGEHLMGEGVGSCNSWESKYRYRTSERVCPSCGAANIRKSTKEPGWYCWAKTGGCGAKFPAGDAAIEKQETGRKPNPDIHDVVNTVMKIAVKRAHVAGTINATNASEFFTQDVEDQVQTPAEQPAESSGKAERRAARDQQKQAAADIAQRKIEGMRAGKSYEQVSTEERRRIEPMPGWCMSLAKVKEKFAELAARMPADSYYEILRACNVRDESQFRGPKEAWECFQVLLGWFEAAADPASYEHFEATEEPVDAEFARGLRSWGRQ